MLRSRLAGLLCSAVALTACGGETATESTDVGASTASPSAASQASSAGAGEPAADSAIDPVACETAWYEHQYGDVAPGFPVTLDVPERDRLLQECQPPMDERKKELSQLAYNTVAQIVEREVRRVSIEEDLPPCEAVYEVLKPVIAGGVPLLPNKNGDVEGYAPDSFLPVLKHNWWGGPFRLKWGVGCEGSTNLWFYADPFPPESSHPDQYPSRADAEADPWNRTPFEARMSTCITWGPKLGNDGVGGEGVIFGFDWTDENLPLDVRSCYPRATGEEGLDRFPIEQVEALPLTAS